jgi:hypothetical protein
MRRPGIFHRLKLRSRGKEPSEKNLFTAGDYGLKTIAEGQHDTAE